MLKSTYSAGLSMDACRLLVEPPFSLEVTVLVLRRVGTNIVDEWADGCWLRAFAGGLATVRQLDEQTLSVSPAAALPLVRRVLGLDVSPALIQQAVSSEPRLQPLADRFAGLRPPRFASLFEAIGMTIPFQQVSLAAGQSIANQLVRRFGTPAWLFPSPEAIAAAELDDLRACGLSAAKARTLQTAARLVLDGQLCESALEALSSEQVLATLDAVPGIGPWTAAVIALRGLGRLDVFPPGDVGARRTLATLLGHPAPLTASEELELLNRLGPARGLVYFLGLAATRLPAPHA
jgi:DNA-3-methyladenine glycosylase II